MRFVQITKICVKVKFKNQSIKKLFTVWHSFTENVRIFANALFQL